MLDKNQKGKYSAPVDEVEAIHTEERTMESATDTKTWPDLAIGLYDRLTGRGAEITYEALDLNIDVPSRVGSPAEHTRWVVNGTLKIRTRDSG
jgi:hypothetical protein